MSKLVQEARLNRFNAKRRDFLGKRSTSRVPIFLALLLARRDRRVRAEAIFRPGTAGPGAFCSRKERARRDRRHKSRSFALKRRARLPTKRAHVFFSCRPLLTRRTTPALYILRAVRVPCPDLFARGTQPRPNASTFSAPLEDDSTLHSRFPGRPRRFDSHRHENKSVLTTLSNPGQICSPENARITKFT